MNSLIEWLERYPEVVIGLSVASVFALLGSVILLIAGIVFVRDDFLLRRSTLTKEYENKKIMRLLLMILRNIVGCILVLLGAALLVLPGQGLLTILFGLLLLDLPGKESARVRLRRFVQRPTTLNKINTLRRKFGKAPLQVYRDD